MDISQNEFETVLNLAENNDGVAVIKDLDLATTWNGVVFNESETKQRAFRYSNRRGILEVVNTGKQDENVHTGAAHRATGDAIEDAEQFKSIQLLNGGHIGDIPIEYRVEGLKDYELAVVGFYVDSRILPGFKYKVRVNGSTKDLYNGEARFLNSIGIGYGKRLTFSKTSKDDTNNHFWSDSNDNGYAFQIEAISCGDEFVICDDSLRPLGRASVQSILLPQKEVSTSIEDGTVTKYVRVVVSISVKYNFERHGMLPLVGGVESVVVQGIAVAVKKRTERRALTVRVDTIFLPKVGSCSLNKEI